MKCSCESEVTACNPLALSPEERAAHPALLRAVHASARRIALDEGTITLEYEPDPEVIARVARWMVLEKKCCPSLSFTLRVGADVVVAAIDGPALGRELLASALRSRSSL